MYVESVVFELPLKSSRVSRREFIVAVRREFE